MTRVDGQPVSLSSFSLSSIFVPVNEQQVALKFFTVPLTSGTHGTRTMRTMITMEWGGLGLSKLCQVFLSGHLHEELFI